MAQSPACKNVSTEREDIGIRHQETSGEDTADWEHLVRNVVNCRVCVWISDSVITVCKFSVMWQNEHKDEDVNIFYFGGINLTFSEPDWRKQREVPVGTAYNTTKIRTEYYIQNKRG